MEEKDKGLPNSLYMGRAKGLPNSLFTSSRMTVRDALNSALNEEMAADPNVFVMDEEVGEYQGAYKWQNRLVKSGSFTHSYPFCWRSDTPLIYRSLPSCYGGCCFGNGPAHDAIQE
ncbi:pyruvate dehydrogenase E1 component subunit beta, mitochondrial-like [Helianthus annuus]|uniref:pyruvate dehydrogenase E1 component subunit beta, mitochondrial-like n=1 Tax=Helianthus annuus TaxID=4232 RepID=UPI000B8F0BD1|nr:pyruvate dehydrogenase E1 component subunit beta, mitochondrial-like [Helianthus annuus]